ncbi:MAG: hypothetical protein GYA55_02740 [SAR324 cluster bacterium]|uniref:Uncharacterized protein n=1 Tax=SAR324 cluster bacterium TaxID=2024889 RepID=A0A7X9FPP7_9DELT|nr:hypothetical protein [SAR324 cluster bacterium]
MGHIPSWDDTRPQKRSKGSLSFPTAPIFDLKKLSTKKTLYAVLTCLAIFQVINVLNSKEGTDPNTHASLFVGPSTTSGPLAIPIYKVSKATKTSIATLSDYQSKIASDFPDLVRLPKNSDFFSEVKDEKPWWSIEGHYVYGPGEISYEGVPAEAEGIANPLILIRPDFVGLSIYGSLVWNKATILENNALQKENFPFHPEPDKLDYFPSESRAEVSYDISRFLFRVNEWTEDELTKEDISFLPVTYNAAFFGFPYAALSSRESQNLAQTDWSKIIFTKAPLRFFYKLCGNPEGCNHRSSNFMMRPAIKVKALPATAVFYLWKKFPTKKRSEPDFKFAIFMY